MKCSTSQKKTECDPSITERETPYYHWSAPVYIRSDCAADPLSRIFLLRSPWWLSSPTSCLPKSTIFCALLLSKHQSWSPKLRKIATSSSWLSKYFTALLGNKLWAPTEGIAIHKTREVELYCECKRKLFRAHIHRYHLGRGTCSGNVSASTIIYPLCLHCNLWIYAFILWRNGEEQQRLEMELILDNYQSDK